MKTLLGILLLLATGASAEMRLSATGDSLWVTEAYEISPSVTRIVAVAFKSPSSAMREWLSILGDRPQMDNSGLLAARPLYAAEIQAEFATDADRLRLGVRLVRRQLSFRTSETGSEVWLLEPLAKCDTTVTGACASYLAEPAWDRRAMRSFWARADSFYATRCVAHIDSANAEAARLDAARQVQQELPW